jgi:hypothetical protein
MELIIAVYLIGFVSGGLVGYLFDGSLAFGWGEAHWTI